MAVLWMGGEDVSFPNGTTLVTVTDSTFFRSGYARLAIRTVNSIQLSTSFVGGAVTSCWLSSRIYWASGHLVAGLRQHGLTQSGGPDAAGKGIYVGTASASSSRLAIHHFDGTTLTQLAAEAGNTLAASALMRLDLQITNYGASSTIKLYANGVEVISWTGDSSIAGITGFDRVVIFNNRNNSSDYFVSEFLVADEDTRNLGVVTCAPNAAGDANAWAGTYAEIDETTINDADVMYENTPDDQAQVNLSDMPAGTFGIKAVMIAARCTKSSDSSVGNIALGVKSGGSVDAGSDQALATVWETKERLMTTNPVTTSPWALSEINPLQLNMKART